MNKWLAAALTAVVLLPTACGSETRPATSPMPVHRDPDRRIIFYLDPAGGVDAVQASARSIVAARDAGDPLSPPMDINTDHVNTAVSLDVASDGDIASKARALRDRFFAAAGVRCILITEIPANDRAGDGSLGSLADRQAHGASCLA